MVLDDIRGVQPAFHHLGHHVQGQFLHLVGLGAANVLQLEHELVRVGACFRRGFAGVSGTLLYVVAAGRLKKHCLMCSVCTVRSGSELVFGQLERYLSMTGVEWVSNTYQIILEGWF